MGKDGANADDVDPLEQFDIDFTVMAGELGNLLRDVAAIFGKDSSDAHGWSSRSKVA